jgi:uncharacterized membrane protein AbrB (regulator of aidB expression)
LEVLYSGTPITVAKRATYRFSPTLGIGVRPRRIPNLPLPQATIFLSCCAVCVGCLVFDEFTIEDKEASEQSKVFFMLAMIFSILISRVLRHLL